MANILVIDDEAVLLGLIASALRLDGHTVRALSDPLEALEGAGDAEFPIDLLVTDIGMRPISGFEVLQRLVKRGIRCKALFMSGYPAMTGAVSAGLGPHALLEKPFTAQELRSAVSKALAAGRTDSRKKGRRTGGETGHSGANG